MNLTLLEKYDVVLKESFEHMYKHQCFLSHKNKVVEIFKNPTQKEMHKNIVPYARGIILSNGDLYVASLSDWDWYDFTHVEFLNKLLDMDVLDIEQPRDLDEYYRMENYNYLFVQRYNDTNNFKLSESYPIDTINNSEEYIQTFFDEAKEKNHLLHFDIEKI